MESNKSKSGDTSVEEQETLSINAGNGDDGGERDDSVKKENRGVHSDGGDGLLNDDHSSSSGNDSSGTSSSDESDDDSHSGDDNSHSGDEGISEYEKLRLARIKRNQQYLAKLGLEGSGKDGKGGILGPAPTKKRTPRASTKQQLPAKRRSTLSRQSKKNVDYTEMPPRFVVQPTDNKHGETGDENPSPAAPRKRRKERSRSHRMEKFIYLEFKRIASLRKQNLKIAKRQVRQAERHVKHWHNRARIWIKKHQREMELERVRQKHDWERQALGGQTLMELLRDLDENSIVMSQLVWEYDQEQRVSG